MPAKSENDDVRTITQGVTKSIALIALIFIIWIDSNNPSAEFQEIELILAGYIAGAEVFNTYKKVTKGKE